MNWEAIGAIGEMIGAAGVIVSILYLSLQIRANTNATRASASFDALHSWAQTNEHLFGLPVDVLEVQSRALDPRMRLSALSRGESTRLVLLYRSIFQKLEGQYYLFKYGLLEPAIWKQRSRIARGYLEVPWLLAWWENELSTAMFTEEFASAVRAADPSTSRGSTAPAHPKRKGREGRSGASP